MKDLETSEMSVAQESRNDAARVLLGLDDDEMPESESYDDCLYDIGSGEFLVLTDEEADERTSEYIADSLWAFNASFLASYMPEGIGENEIQAIRGDRCENANDALRALVNAGPRDFDDLVRDAIMSDGRGDFLSSYDGEEIEQKIGETYWYAYRVN